MCIPGALWCGPQHLGWFNKLAGETQVLGVAEPAWGPAVATVTFHLPATALHSGWQQLLFLRLSLSPGVITTVTRVCDHQQSHGPRCHLQTRPSQFRVQYPAILNNIDKYLQCRTTCTRMSYIDFRFYIAPNSRQYWAILLTTLLYNVSLQIVQHCTYYLSILFNIVCNTVQKNCLQYWSILLPILFVKLFDIVKNCSILCNILSAGQHPRGVGITAWSTRIGRRGAMNMSAILFSLLSTVSVISFFACLMMVPQYCSSFVISSEDQVC